VSEVVGRLLGSLYFLQQCFSRLGAFSGEFFLVGR
jgi:hypothetical protein